MGCGGSHNVPNNPAGHLRPGRRTYTVFIHHPNQNHPRLLSAQTNRATVHLGALMNHVLFDSGEVHDANFIVRYNEKKEKFEYFVQRLLGQEMQFEESPYSGKMWVPYINSERYDWDEICECDILVKPSDKIEWKYEMFTRGGVTLGESETLKEPVIIDATIIPEVSEIN